MATKNKNLSSKTKKGKYVDFDKNNVDCSSSIQVLDKPKTVYETPLQTLSRLFPDYETDILETLFEENFRNFHRTKMCIEKMNESYKIETVPQIEDVKASKDQCSKEVESPHMFINFKYDFDYSLNIEDKKEDLGRNKGNHQDEEVKIEVESEELESKDNKLVKSEVKYTSELSNFNQNNNGNNYGKRKSHYLEEYMLDDYIKIIKEIFPELNRIEILNKICDFDFNIDLLVLFLLDEKYAKTINLENLESSEISKDYLLEFVNNAFEKRNDDYKNISETISKHNLQKDIEKRILSDKPEKKNSTNKLEFNETNFPYLDEDQKLNDKNHINSFEEDFLDKELHKIKNFKIRNELTNLIKMFPLIEEFTIRWVYYQFMDFHESKQYLSKQSNLKTNAFEKKNAVVKSEVINKNTNNKESLKRGRDNLASELYNIISNKPVSWKLDETNNNDVNINNYREMRKNLIMYARRAWALGKYQDAKVIIAKANRYKEEFSNLIDKRKLNIFTRNNQYNLNYTNEATIDLHGLNYEESKILIKKKIIDVNNEISRGNIKKFNLNIITGVGHHSNNFEPVLFPRLSIYFKEHGYKFKINREQGNIKVIL